MRAAALAPALALAACDTRFHASQLGPLDAAADCEEAKSHSDLAWIQTHVFNRSCAFSACHAKAIPDSAMLSLADGASWAALVGQPAQSSVATADTAHGTWMRVVPGEPANSYLMVLIDPAMNPSKFGGVDPPGPGGVPDGGILGPVDTKVGSMPEYNDLVCAEKRAAVYRWIAQGAPDTPTTPTIDAGVPDAPP